jgi:hypothetical protein
MEWAIRSITLRNLFIPISQLAAGAMGGGMRSFRQPMIIEGW